MNNILPYDETSPQRIEDYSRKLLGKTFYDVLKDNYGDNLYALEDKARYFRNPSSKGSLGNLIEEFFFFYKPNSKSEPDFPKAGVELKVTPYELTTKGKVRAGERLVITMIPFDEPIDIDLKDAHLLNKLNLILLILYLRVKGVDRTTYQINYSKLFSILGSVCKEDLVIIESDYRKIARKIVDGKAHELSEGDTLYLGACTKGATAEKSIHSQYYNSEVQAKRRAFCLKQGYMTQLINKYIIGDVETYEPIFKDSSELEGQDFEALVLKRIQQYVGKSEEELLSYFEISYKGGRKPKNSCSLLAFRMLNVKSNNAEEFVKADIDIKTIRLEENKMIKEHMSFPIFKIKDFIAEEWEDSGVNQYFSQNKFLLMVFQKNASNQIFKGAQFWNMPVADLEGTGYLEWEKAQQVFREGIILTPRKTKKGIIVLNNLPNSSETQIFHVRPHQTETAYLINGIKYGKGDLEKYTDELPNGDLMTKQCFWLKNSYILKQLEDELKR